MQLTLAIVTGKSRAIPIKSDLVERINAAGGYLFTDWTTAARTSLEINDQGKLDTVMIPGHRVRYVKRQANNS